MKDELGGQIMKEFVGFRAKAHSPLKENNGEDKKAIVTRKCAINRKLKFRDYKNCLNAAKIDGKIESSQKVYKNKYIHTNSLMTTVYVMSELVK